MRSLVTVFAFLACSPQPSVELRHLSDPSLRSIIEAQAFDTYDVDLTGEPDIALDQSFIFGLSKIKWRDSAAWVPLEVLSVRSKSAGFTAGIGPIVVEFDLVEGLPRFALTIALYLGRYASCTNDNARLTSQLDAYRAIMTESPQQFRYDPGYRCDRPDGAGYVTLTKRIVLTNTPAGLVAEEFPIVISDEIASFAPATISETSPFDRVLPLGDPSKTQRPVSGREFMTGR
jgi:hypothetical protein